MAVNQARRQSSFIVRTMRLSWARVRHVFGTVNAWRRAAVGYVDERLRAVHRYLVRHGRGIFLSVALVVFAVLLTWFIYDWREGQVSGNAVQTGVGGLIGGSLVSAVLSLVAAAAAFGSLLALNFLMRLVAPLLLFVPPALIVPGYALAQLVNVILQLFLLVPLVIMFVATRAAHWAQKRRNTCPDRSCPSQQLPNYVCPDCGTANPDLWPSLVGLLHHPCLNDRCDRWLPTLDLLGRDKLQKRCAACGMPLDGRHTLKGPERLISLAGASGAGKTCYLLMAVHELTNGGPATFHGEIDVAEDEQNFAVLSAALGQGQAPAMTTAVQRAFLLWTKVGAKHCQLYLYDNPGEEFRQDRTMTEQQYFNLVEGVVLLVDPYCFKAAADAAGAGQHAERFDLVVQTMVNRSFGTVRAAKGRINKRVAVVLSKADEPLVVERLGGDIREGPVPGERVRQLLIDWGGQNEVNTLTNLFSEVAYFACSPLGRAETAGDHSPFRGSGILPPLYWVLTGEELRR